MLDIEASLGWLASSIDVMIGSDIGYLVFVQRTCVLMHAQKDGKRKKAFQ